MNTHFDEYSTRDAAQMLFNLRDQMSEFQRKIKELEGAANAFRDVLIGRLSQAEEGQRFVRCASGTVTVVWKSGAVVEDLSALQKHILATGELDLLQNRISEEAVRQRWEVGDVVPGIARRDFQKLSISTTKKEPRT